MVEERKILLVQIVGIAVDMCNPEHFIFVLKIELLFIVLSNFEEKQLL